MTREEALLELVQASAIFQHNLAQILEGQAREAEKSSHWIRYHLSADRYESHEKQVDQSIEIHEQIISVLEGLTKLESSLSSCLRVILQHDEQEKSRGFDFSGGLFGGMNGELA